MESRTKGNFEEYFEGETYNIKPEEYHLIQKSEGAETLGICDCSGAIIICREKRFAYLAHFIRDRSDQFEELFTNARKKAAGKQIEIILVGNTSSNTQKKRKRIMELFGNSTDDNELRKAYGIQISQMARAIPNTIVDDTFLYGSKNWEEKYRFLDYNLFVQINKKGVISYRIEVLSI